MMFVDFAPSMPQNDFSTMPPPGMGFNMPPQTPIFTDPVVANMAVQYGQALVGSGKQMMDKEIEKYVSISRLKYLFAVDTSYVSKKLSIILFPFLHSVSSSNFFFYIFSTHHITFWTFFSGLVYKI